MSVVNTEMSLEVQRVVIMIFSIDLGGGGGNFFNFLQKEGVPRKEGGGKLCPIS